MKRLLIVTTAGLLALSGAASAMTNATASLQGEVNGYVSGVNLDGLTNAQVDAIKLSVHSGDSAAETRALIYSIVNG